MERKRTQKSHASLLFNFGLRNMDMKSLNARDLQPGIKIIFSKSPSAYINRGELCEVESVHKYSIFIKTINGMVEVSNVMFINAEFMEATCDFCGHDLNGYAFKNRTIHVFANNLLSCYSCGAHD